jgi:hypothetical protein
MHAPRRLLRRRAIAGYWAYTTGAGPVANASAETASAQRDRLAFGIFAASAEFERN